MTEPTHSLSIDIGGTFTDFTLLNIESGELNVHKVLTDPENPTTALMRGVAELLETVGVDSIRKLRRSRSAQLHKALVDANKNHRKPLVRRMPSQDQLKYWLEQAKQLSQIVK